jgi:hypothetical protein
MSAMAVTGSANADEGKYSQNHDDQTNDVDDGIQGATPLQTLLKAQSACKTVRRMRSNVSLMVLFHEHKA